MNTGFFTVEVLNDIEACSNIETARFVALLAVDNQPKAFEKNKKKAIAVIHKAKSKKQLLISLANFMLAHPSEGLAMTKGT